MSDTSDVQGRAVVLAPGAFATTPGKTGNGLVRFTRRFQIVAVLDPTYAGKDAGDVLDGKPRGIPIVSTIEEAMKHDPQWAIVGVAPDGGRLPPHMRADIVAAIKRGVSIVSGLHEFMNEDPEFATLAKAHGVRLVDVRALARSEHFYTGKIDEVRAPRIAVLGTDSAIGKRTTSWRLHDALEEMGFKVGLVGTGQTGWMQGADQSILLDRIVNDFVTGEIEHAVHTLWTRDKPDLIILEGQGALTHPAYPGGFELINGGRVGAIVMVHAPARKGLDGFAQYPMPDLGDELKLMELMIKKPVSAIAINHEDMTRAQVDAIAVEYEDTYGMPAADALWHGAAKLAQGVLATLGIPAPKNE